MENRMETNHSTKDCELLYMRLYIWILYWDLYIIWINMLSLDVWFVRISLYIWLRYNYLKIWNLRVQKNLNIEKITFKDVQIKSQATYIANQKV